MFLRRLQLMLKRSICIFINNQEDLIKFYYEKCKKLKVSLVGHPAIDEVRLDKKSRFTKPYSLNNIGKIKPSEKIWWLAIVEFLEADISSHFEQEFSKGKHYLFGTV